MTLPLVISVNENSDLCSVNIFVPCSCLSFSDTCAYYSLGLACPGSDTCKLNCTMALS